MSKNLDQAIVDYGVQVAIKTDKVSREQERAAATAKLKRIVEAKKNAIAAQCGNVNEMRAAFGALDAVLRAWEADNG